MAFASAHGALVGGYLAIARQLSKHHAMTPQEKRQHREMRKRRVEGRRESVRTAQAARLDRQADANEKRAIKMSKKHLRGGRRARKAAIAAGAYRNQAERKEKRLAATRRLAEPR